MKEMVWTREEALKRLTFMFKSTEDDMKHLAIKGVAAPDKRLRERLLDDACEKANFMIGIVGAAESFGIGLEEMMELEVDGEEMNNFIKELSDSKKTEFKHKKGERLSDLLSELFG